jgi:Ca-activated chloride channel family protein
MQFANAEYLQLLWLVPAMAVFFFFSLRNRRRRLERLIAPSLIPVLAREHSRARSVLRSLLLLGFFAFAVLALARPQWGTRLDTLRRRGVDIIIALDTSYSMKAEDVAPTRLAKAKSEIRSLINRLKGDRIGLVSFAGTAIMQCPLTLDYGAAALFLDVANTEMIPEPGTSLAAAIQAARDGFNARERKYKVLIVVTDGEDLQGQVDEAVESAKEAGILIYAIGIGTPEGKPIPVRDARGDIVEYHKDSNGQIVISRLDEKALARIASAVGGSYYRATTSESELDELYGEISQLEKKELESRVFQNFEDQFQYPLGVAILLLAGELWISERRRPSPAWLGRFDELRRDTITEGTSM